MERVAFEKFVEGLGARFKFAGGVNDEVISDFEKSIGLLFPLQNYGEFFYCIKVEEADYSIVQWSSKGGSKEVQKSLLQFIHDEFSEALDL